MEIEPVEVPELAFPPAGKTVKKRGRPPAGKTAQQASDSIVSHEKTRSQELKPNRPDRVPMRPGSKLNYNQREGYKYRWVESKPGNVEAAKAAYYDFVREDGEPVKRPSGALYLYLMEIEEKYFLEDQKLMADQIRGSVDSAQELSAGEYLPEGRHHFIQKDEAYDPLA
jgi:hypothetical protein